MARPQKEAYELTDAEKRDLMQLIQQGKNLPEKYGRAPRVLQVAEVADPGGDSGQGRQEHSRGLVSLAIVTQLSVHS